MAGEIEIVVLTATFDARAGAEEQLAAVLARYVVLTRQEDGCRNVDLLASTTQSGRILVIEKWGSESHARAHLDSQPMRDMAEAAIPLLVAKPDIDLYATISAHDLT